MPGNPFWAAALAEAVDAADPLAGFRDRFRQEAMAEKYNEINAVPILLQRLELEGALVTSMP